MTKRDEKQLASDLLKAELEAGRRQQDSEIADLKADLATSAHSNKALRKLVAEQQVLLDNLHDSTFTLTYKPPEKIEGSYCRLIVPDSHGSKIQPEAASAMLGDLSLLHPKEVIFLGDHVDCGGFLAQHFTFSYTEEMDYTYSDDVRAASTFLDAVQKECPGAAFHYVEGNHEARVTRWCVTAALKQGSPGDAKYLAKQFKTLFDVPNVLHLKKRGIKYHTRTSKSKVLKGRGAIKLGRCLFVHGHRAGIFAARRMLEDYSANVVFGHVHQRQSTTKWSSDGEIGAWCPGTLSEIMPLYRHGSPTHWTHGYAIQLVSPNRDFLHINIPIIKGQSLLKTMPWS